MKKIAFVINVFREDNFHSGGEKLYYELLVKAIEKGYLVDLYCTKYLYNKDVPELKSRINKLEVFGNAKHYKYPEKIEKLYGKILQCISKERYDHVISENITPPIDIGVLQGHSLTHYKNMAGNFFAQAIFALKKHKFIKAQKKWMKKGYKKIFVPSETLKKELMTNFNIVEDKIIIIYPGVDAPENIKTTSYEDIILEKKELIFGISAPSFSKKGGFIFLKALKILKNQGYKFKAKVIYPKASKNFALNLKLKLWGLKDYVKFYSYQEKMDDFYNLIDCMVMPSLLETFGLVALETMIRKKAVIVSSYSGASEIINDRENGFIFDISKNSSENLAEQMKFVLENKDKLAFISQNAFETAQKHKWASAADLFIDKL